MPTGTASHALWQLNWKEWEALARTLDGALAGAFWEAVSVPPRADAPEGFLKGEWLLHFSHPQARKPGERITLWLSLRSQRPALRLLPAPPRGVNGAPLPPWLQKAFAELGGKRLERLEAFPEERILRFVFAEWALVISMIPAKPEARLESLDWAPPRRGEVPELVTRPRSPEGEWTRSLWQDVEREVLASRVARLERECKERLRKLGKSSRESEAHAPQPAQIAQWTLWGDLLLTHAHSIAKSEGGHYSLEDLDSGETVRVPIPKAGPSEPRALAQHYYEFAKKKRRGISEVDARSRDASERIERLKSILEKLALSTQPPSRDELVQWEAELGLGGPARATRPKGGEEIPGKTFVSRDGAAIHVGRNKKENLALTLKVARGNDVWLHLRGRPSSHAIVPVPGGKSASLETLLDAAQLIIHYGGGADWGTTEVDYTFRKYVKRIPKSDEVSYTQEKTLLVKPDRARLARLLGQGGA